jgi:hypothetical protein
MYKHLHALWLFKQFSTEDIDYLLDVDLIAYLNFFSNEMRIWLHKLFIVIGVLDN